ARTLYRRVVTEAELEDAVLRAGRLGGRAVLDPRGAGGDGRGVRIAQGAAVARRSIRRVRSAAEGSQERVGGRMKTRRIAHRRQRSTAVLEIEPETAEVSYQDRHALLTGGDVDADWQRAEASGEEAVGGSEPTPDQDVVDEIG